MTFKYFSKSKEEILFLICAPDSKLISNSAVLKLVNDVRGGGLGDAASILLIIIMGTMWLNAMGGEAFIQNLGGRGINPLPARNDFLFPRRTAYVDWPGGSVLMERGNSQSSREKLTQLSTEVVQTQTQMSSFQKNGDVDLNKCLKEVDRRAAEIGCTNFECSLERFKELAT